MTKKNNPDSEPHTPMARRASKKQMKVSTIEDELTQIKSRITALRLRMGQYTVTALDKVTCGTLRCVKSSSQVGLIQEHVIPQDGINANQFVVTKIARSEKVRSSAAFYLADKDLSAKIEKGLSPADAHSLVLWDDDDSDVVMYPILISDVDYSDYLGCHHAIPITERRYESAKWATSTEVAADYLHYVWRDRFSQPFLDAHLANYYGKVGLSHMVHWNHTSLESDTSVIGRDLWPSQCIILRPMTTYMLSVFLQLNGIDYFDAVML